MTRPESVAVAACLDLVSRQRHGVSFAELAAVCERVGVQTAGDVTLWGATVPNVALWAGMSAEFAAICAQVYRHPSVTLVASVRSVFDKLGADPPAVAGMARASWPPHPAGYRRPHVVAAAFAWREPLIGAANSIGRPCRTRSDSTSEAAQ